MITWSSGRTIWRDGRFAIISSKDLMKMAVAQTAESETLYRRILELPESKFCRVVEFVDRVENDDCNFDVPNEPNEETIRVIKNQWTRKI